MIRNKLSKRLISLILVMVTIVTMLPTSFLTVLAATSSGQVEINNGSKYAVQWADLYYPGQKVIYQYNRSLTGTSSASNYTYSNGWYNILKKYVASSSGGQKEPTSSVVPIYRVSRDNGDTNSDTTATAVNTINIENANNLYNSAVQDGISLTKNQANMIVKVLIAGLKQFTSSKGTTQYYKEELYFLATQVIIWEIQEGKRVGWTNSAYSYTNTQSSSYPSNARSMIRNTNLSQAYGYPSGDEKENKYYWHDYYYTVYNNQFSGYPDYYNEILEVCANVGEDFKYGTGSTPNLNFANNVNTVYKMEKGFLSSSYEFTFVVSSSFVGESYGKYDVNDIVLPIDEVITKPNGSKVIYSLPNNGSAKLSNGFSSSIGINGITVDGYYYYIRFSNTKYGFIKVSDVPGSYSSNVSVTPSQNLLGHTKLTFKTSVASQDILKIRWPKNAANAFNDPVYFKNSGTAVRGYVSGGNQTEETVYFNLQAGDFCKVTFKCGICNKVIETRMVKEGDRIKLSSFPTHEEDSRYYYFSHWSKGSQVVSNSLLGEKITEDTTYVMNFEKVTKTVNFWCTISEGDSSEYVLIKSYTEYPDTNITVPQMHSHSGYEQGYWATPSSYAPDSGIVSGQKYNISDLSSDYYAVYDEIYTVEYRCELCDELLGVFSGVSGTTYTVPQETHTHTKPFVDESSGEEISYDELDVGFKGWSNLLSSGSTATIKGSETIYANYYFKNDIIIETNLYNKDTATEDEKDEWWSRGVSRIKYTINSTSVSNYSFDSENLTSTYTFNTRTDQFDYIKAVVPDGWHVVKYEIVDANGEKIVYTNGLTPDKINSKIAENKSSNIKIYYEPETVQKTVTINYVSAGQECDFRNDDNALILSRSVTVDYNEPLDIINRKITDNESGMSFDAFEGYLDYNGMMYMYAGEYGYIQDDNLYNHYAGDKVGLDGTLPELTDYKVTSNINIYIYYDLPEDGGIDFSLYATSLGSIGGFELETNNSSLKMYSSETSLELSQVLLTDNEGNTTINSLLKFESDLTEKISLQVESNDGSVEGYPAETYPLVSTIKFSPEDLQIGKFYYFVYEDCEYDKFYYSPIVTGGIAWTGSQLKYNTICDIGPVLQTLQIMTEDKDGNVAPAQNAKVFLISNDGYADTYSYIAAQVLTYLLMVSLGKMTLEEFQAACDTLYYEFAITCSVCGERWYYTYGEDDEDVVCPYCGTEGVSSGLGTRMSDDNGLITFYSNPDDTGEYSEEYLFILEDDDFLINGETSNPIYFSEKTTRVYERDQKTGLSNGVLLSSSDNYSETGELIRASNTLNANSIYEAYDNDGTEEVEDENGNKVEVQGENGRAALSIPNGTFTVCTLYQALRPLTFDFDSTDESVDLFSLTDGTVNLQVFKDNAFLESKEYSVTDCQYTYESDSGIVQSFGFSYIPPDIGNYTFKVSFNNVSSYENGICVSPASRNYEYTSNTDTLYYDVSTVNRSKDVCFSMVFDSDLMAKVTGGKIGSVGEINPLPDDYVAGEYSQYTLDTFGLKSFEIFYNTANTTDFSEDEFLSFKLDTIPASVLDDALKNSPTELLFPRANWGGKAVVNLYQTTYTGESGSNYTIEIYELASGSDWQVVDKDNNSGISGYLRNDYDELYPKHKNSFFGNKDDTVVNKIAIMIKINDVPDGYYFLNPVYNDTYVYNGEIAEQRGVYTTKASYLTGDSVDYTTITKVFPPSDSYDDIIDWLGINSKGTYAGATTYPNDYTTYNVFEWDLGGVLVQNPYYSTKDEKWIYPEADIGTSWEAVPIVFTQTKTSELPNDVNPDYSVEFVEPNSSYTYDTDVISTFIVTNNNETEYTDSNPLDTEFVGYVEYVENGTNKSFQLETITKDLVLPASKQNITYYKWHIPSEEEILNEISNSTGTNKSDIQLTDIKVTIDVKEETSSYTVSKNAIVDLTSIIESQVFDEGYNPDGGDGFVYKEPTENTADYANMATWQEYVCENGEFFKIETTAKLGYVKNELTPYSTNPTNKLINNKITTRSGYALQLETQANITNYACKYVDTDNSLLAEEINALKEASTTSAQSAFSYFPEFNYASANGQFETLLSVDNSFIFAYEESNGTDASRHYVPVWYPDGDYIVQTWVGNMWTPAGMLSYLGNTNTVSIQGSLFDDYITQDGIQ